jgi:hypothetical protein
MPFFGIVPPTQRVQGIFGGATNAPIGTAPLNNIVDGTAQAVPGIVGWYKDPQFGRISVVAYAQAQSSIAYGDALTKVAGVATTLSSAGASIEAGFGLAFVAKASTGAEYSGYTHQFAGVAAASVINTGHFFWRYISGYVPNARCGSVIASGKGLVVAGSVAGVLSGALASHFNATTTNGTQFISVGYPISTTDAADGSVASIYLTGWYA